MEPAFDRAVAPGGYAWWYLDALSDDGRHGLTVIAFIGSVFSPYYAWARRRAPGGRADAQAHCAVNAVLYGDAGARWAMTERGRGQLERSARALRIGRSTLQWDDARTLTVTLDEVTAPWPSRLRGQVRVHAAHVHDRPQGLAPGHWWCPIAPVARVEVDVAGRRWSGNGYLDANHGDAALERDFVRWDWSRAHLADGDGLVFYDAEPRAAAPVQLALRFGADGRMTPVADAPPRAALPRTRWRLPRHARGDAGTSVQVQRTLTDAPFYARSQLSAPWFGERVDAVHESLSLERFASPWVQAMLPFRMPRRARGG